MFSHAPLGFAPVWSPVEVRKQKRQVEMLILDLSSPNHKTYILNCMSTNFDKGSQHFLLHKRRLNNAFYATVHNPSIISELLS